MDSYLLKVILEILEAPVTKRTLKQKQNLTTRQLNYRLEKINELLEQNKHIPLQIDKNQTIIIDKASRKYLQKTMNEQQDKEAYFMDREERMICLYLLMFTNDDYLSLNHFISFLQVSRTTVLSDIKDLSLILQANKIQITNDRVHGYYLNAPEIDILHYLMCYVVSYFTNENGKKLFFFFNQKTEMLAYQKVKSIMLQIMQNYPISFVGDKLDEFIYIFIFIAKRVKSKTRKIQYFPQKDMLKTTTAFAFVQDLLAHYQALDNIDNFDINYLTAWVIGSATGNADEKTEDYEIISELVNKVLIRFESISGVHYTNYSNIYRQLYAHFRPAYYRLLYRLPISNIYKDKVKENYEELYNLVEKTMEPFNFLFSEKIPDTELAYLTLHFGSVFTAQAVANKVAKKKAVILCTNGIGSSAILYSELVNLFPDLEFFQPQTTSEISQISDFDMIFATKYIVDIEKYNKPIIRVTPVMTAKEKYRVEREVYQLFGGVYQKKPEVADILTIIDDYIAPKYKQEIHEKLLLYLSEFEVFEKNKYGQLSLQDIIKPYLIKLNIEATDWEDALNQSAAPFIEHQYVSQNYVDEIIENIKKIGPYIVIAQHVALPHTKIEAGSYKLGIGIATLTTPITFGLPTMDPIKYIFFLSAIDNETHLKAMAELVKLLETEKFFKTLDRATKPETIIKFLKRNLD